MENEKKEFIKYNKPTTTYIVIGFGAFFTLLVILCGSELSTFTHIGGFILGVGLIVGGIYEIVKFNNMIKSFEENGKMVTILSDFRNGTKAFDGKLIIGQTWLIGNKTGTILQYSDVVRFYQTIHKTNYIEDGRTVTAVTKDGKRVQLCNLKTRGKSSDELDYFFSFISSNYPEIALGYDGPQA